MNERASHHASGDPKIRRLVAEMIDESPSASTWSQVEQRADQPNRVTPIMDQRPGTSRPGLMLVAAAAIVALVGVAAAVATRGSGSDDRLVPADSELASTLPEATVATTEAPLFEPVVTAETDPVEPSPVSIGPDAIELSDPEVDDGFVSDVTTDDVIVPVDYPEVPLVQATNLPMDAWVVAGTLPEGISPRYATAEVGRTVVYGDIEGRTITVHTDPQPLGAGEPLDVDGIEWGSVTFDDTTTYAREIGLVAVSVTMVGLDRDAALAVLADLRAGGDQVLPVDVIQPIGIVRRDSDLVAIDENAFGRPATFRARGVNGWYCAEVFYSIGSTGGCGLGRNGQLSSDVLLNISSFPEDAAMRAVLSGIVSPEVAEIEVVFTDGTTARTSTGDISGLHDDSFWIVEIQLGNGDPFIDQIGGVEVRLLGVDGSLLGLAPVPE